MTRGHLQIPPDRSEVLAPLLLTVPLLPQGPQSWKIGNRLWEESQALPGTLNLAVTSSATSPWKLKFC